MVASPSLMTTSHPWKGRGQGQNFTPPEISLQRLQLETSNFVHKLATWSVSLVMTNCPPSGAWSGLRDSFLHFGAHTISLERMKLDISNLVCWLSVKSTAVTYVKVLQYGVHSGSRDLLKFWEIIASISEMVHDRQLQWKTNRKSCMCPIESTNSNDL